MRRKDGADVGPRRKRVGFGEHRHRCRKSGDANHEQYRRCDSTGATFAALGRRRALTLEPASCEQRERRKHWQRIVFLPRGETEKQHDHRGPDRAEKIGARSRVETFTPGTNSPRNLTQRREQVDEPREEPREQQRPEKQQRDLVVIVGNALVQIAQELFVDEVKPEEAFLGSAGCAGLRIAARMCHGAATARKTRALENR